MPNGGKYEHLAETWGGSKVKKKYKIEIYLCHLLVFTQDGIEQVNAKHAKVGKDPSRNNGVPGTASFIKIHFIFSGKHFSTT